jgi:putative ABC transport system permease protein
MAIWTQIRAALRRRRAQTAVVLLLCLLASSVSTLALTLLVRSTGPWDAAYSQIDGPHLVFHFDPARVTPAQLRETATLPGVMQVAGPQESAVVPFEAPGQKGRIQVIGRAGPGGAFDRLLVVAGRWPRMPGEIAVTRTSDSSVVITPHVGDTIHALNSAGRPAFKVVGEVVDVVPHGVELDYSAGVPAAWVLPGQVAPLIDGRDVHPGYVMAYRFSAAATDDEIAHDRQVIEDALPAASESSPPFSWLQARSGSVWLISLMSGIILAFTLFALGGVAVIVASAVAGAVVAGYRDIGMLKALGFTPLQVLLVYLGQMALPAAAAAAVGVVFGSLASRPFLASAASTLDLPTPPIFDLAVDLLVPIAVVVLVVLATLAPALRGARTSAVHALAIGSAPRDGRRSRLGGALTALRAPRAMSLGAADAFARPVRAGLTVVALTVGIATAVFSSSFQATVGAVISDRASLGVAQDLIVQRYPGIGDSDLMRQLTGDQATRLVVATRAMLLDVAGVSAPVQLVGMRGDGDAFGYRAVRGRWFHNPGEAVIGPAVAQAAHVRLGDSLVTRIVGGADLPVRVVGIFNDFNTNGQAVRVDWATLAAAEPGIEPDSYLVKLRPGSNAQAYARRVTALAPHFIQVNVTSFAAIDQPAGLLSGLVFGLAVVLLLISAAGLLNAALLTAKERVHDISILKAVGMEPAQVGLMVVSATGVLCAAGMILGVPLGAWLQLAVWQSILPASAADITFPSALSPVPLAGALVAAALVALLGASIPARWAVRTPVAAILRAE